MSRKSMSSGKPKSEVDGKIYLLQTYENGSFFIYEWTPTLAKKGFKALKGSEALPYIQMVKQGKNHTKFLAKGKREVVEAAQESVAQDQDAESLVISEVIVDSVDRPPEIVEKSDGALKTSEDIYNMELAYIDELKSIASLESHLLQKYKIELPESESPEDLREVAKVMLLKLKDEDKLYLIDGRV